MKTTTTFLTVLILSLLASTNAKASQLYLRTHSGTYVTATISGYVYSSRNGEIRAHDLRPGNHHITVVAQHRNRRGYRSYREANHRNRDRILYRGRIHIPNRSTVYARITPGGRMLIDEVVMHRPPKPKYKHNPRRYDNRGPQPPPTRHRDHRRRGDYGNSQAFDAALNLIRDASFESEKLAIAKQFTAANPVSSNEVLLISQAFDFESSKLNYAKFAYRHTIDPENYFVVNKTFDFSSSVLALNKFIQ